MPSYNRVILAGNLTRDPELKYTANQTPVCSFGMAVNSKYRTKSGEDREDVLFVDCACFGKAGETINQYCQKGKPILIEGKLKFETWEDKQGGGKRSKHTILVEGFQFLGGRDDAGGQGQPPQQSLRQRASAPVSSPVSDGKEFDDSEIPF